MFKVHNLKTLAAYYAQVISGKKTFELRYNDRDFQAGDLLVLNEIDGPQLEYTGRECLAEVVYVMDDKLNMYLQPGYVALSIRLLTTRPL